MKTHLLSILIGIMSQAHRSVEKPSVLSLILLRGDNNKHTHLFVEFEEFDRANEEKHAKVEYHSSKNKTDTL